jgi:hypothetical protein
LERGLEIIQLYHRITSFFAFFCWPPLVFDDASRIQAVGCGCHIVYSSEKYEVSHGIFSDSDFLFSLCFIHIFNGTPWQFIFFFGTCCVPAVNLGLRGGKLVVAHI